MFVNGIMALIPFIFTLFFFEATDTKCVKIIIQIFAYFIMNFQVSNRVIHFHTIYCSDNLKYISPVLLSHGHDKANL